MSTVCQRNKEKKRNTYLRVKNGVEILFRCWVIKICIIFLPPSLFSASQFRGWISRPRPDSALSPHVNSAESRRGGVGGGLGSPLGGFPQTQILVFWWFLQIYLTTASFSCWYFLLLKQRIFWCYSSLQLMAILCCVAKKQLLRHRKLFSKWSEHIQ